MGSPDVNLHRIDLEQIELYQKLHARLGRELRAIGKITHLIALRESSLDAEALNLNPPADAEEDNNTSTLKNVDAITALDDQLIKMIKLCKTGIWQTSEKLRNTHFEQREERERDLSSEESKEN